jgi:hypothetical protein
MNLFEAMQIYDNDCFDTCDTVFDAIVTVSKMEDGDDDNYSNFCKELYKKTDFVKFFDGTYANAVVNWTGLIEKNYTQFEKFVIENWIDEKQYVLEDKDDFIYEWIEQIHLLIAGYGSESTYKDLLELLTNCK